MGCGSALEGAVEAVTEVVRDGISFISCGYLRFFLLTLMFMLFSPLPRDIMESHVASPGFSRGRICTLSP